MKICFASLRKTIAYADVLKYGMDVFYESYKHYIKNNTQHTFSFYNFAFNHNKKTVIRDINAIEEADVIIFPAVQEFIYFAKAMDPRDVERSQEHIRKLYKHLNNKHFILMTQDRGVDKDLILKHTLENKVNFKSFQIIDEMDFTLSLQGLKYHFIKRIPNFDEHKKLTDFVYWGSDKRKIAGGENSNDERYNIIKSIHKNETIKDIIIGRWPKAIKVEKKWISLNDVIPYLQKSYSTLCFNWIDQTAVTGRYHESLACDVFPFVWKDYDTNNTLVTDGFQRIFTIDEFYDKIKEIKKSDKWLNTIKKDFLNKLPTENEYYKEFESVLNKCLTSF